jgi:hypothetical protein
MQSDITVVNKGWPMKLFTIDEANELLQVIVPKLHEIRRLYEIVEEMRADARAAAGASEFGGGMLGGTGYVNTLYMLGKLTTEIHEAGVELKDHRRGLIDFPSLRADRVVYLCWQLGEGEVIEWWHETDGGFDGRQPL